MGAWDVGPFDNDGAGDWSAEVRDAADPRSVAVAALEEVLAEEEYVDRDVASAAIAAAAWLASGVPGGPSADSAYAPRVPAPPIDRDLAALALASVARATGTTEDGPPSEWRDLWDEAESTDEALAAIEPALIALRGV